MDAIPEARNHYMAAPTKHRRSRSFESLPQASSVAPAAGERANPDYGEAPQVKSSAVAARVAATTRAAAAAPLVHAPAQRAAALTYGDASQGREEIAASASSSSNSSSGSNGGGGQVASSTPNKNTLGRSKTTVGRMNPALKPTTFQRTAGGGGGGGGGAAGNGSFIRGVTVARPVGDGNDGNDGKDDDDDDAPEAMSAESLEMDFAEHQISEFIRRTMVISEKRSLFPGASAKTDMTSIVHLSPRRARTS